MLAEFSMAYEWKQMGDVAQIVPFPMQVTLRQAYRLPGGRTPPLSTWREAFSDAELEIVQRELQVEGPWELHQGVRDWISGRSIRTPTNRVEQKSLTLTIGSATLEQATDYLAKQLDLTFEFTPQAETRLQQRITLEVACLGQDRSL